MNYYHILGIPRTASMEQVRRAYREQIKFFHPDVFDGPPEVARIKTLQLNEAYEVLYDPQKRKEYDFRLEYEERKAREEARRTNAEAENRRQAEKERQQREETERHKREEENQNRKEKQKAEDKKYDVHVLKIQRNIFASLSAVLFAFCILISAYFIFLEDRKYEGNHKDSAIVYVRTDGAKYHEKGCSDLNGRGISISLKDAYASGYRACHRCGAPDYPDDSP